MKAYNTDVFDTATNESELSNSDLMAINGGANTLLGNGLGQVSIGLSTILNPVVGRLLILVNG